MAQNKLTSYTYVIRDDESGRVKIGRSVDPRNRLSALQIGSSSNLTLLGIVEGEDEQTLHARLSGHRVRGEWFSSEVLEHIALAPAPVVNRRVNIDKPTVQKPKRRLNFLRPARSNQKTHGQLLIDHGHEFHRKTGRPPTAKDFQGVRGAQWPSYRTCIRAFGSWDNYIAACGWEPRGRGRPRKS